ncbi:hypothetical protein TWF718_003449 [Orbilia javanica]|uniref:F-box domain-containing protein n=1 Tax=Orbilia javanica TaxID=47235 RepID=A0AAN8MIQ6_9PEZI
MDRKRLSSLQLSSKSIGKALWGKAESSNAESSTASTPRPQVVEPPLLPTEILRFIFELLWESEPSSEDVQNFRQSCRLFNEISLEYIYSDVVVSLNEGGSDSGSLAKLLKHSENTIAHISRLQITGFPPAPRRSGFSSLRPSGKYGSDSRRTSRENLKTLLELLSPNKLTTFAINGRHIPERIDRIPVSLLFGKHPNLRQLCIPITLLFQHGINTSEALGSTAIPTFQSLILTDLRYPRHISDVWTLLRNSEDTLKSLALKSPPDSDLENFLIHRGRQGLTAGLPSTVLSLHNLQDLHLEGFPNIDKVFEDCAPNLVNLANIRTLRLERCQQADAFLLASLSVYRMPKLKSLQLIETGSNLALDGILPLIGSMKLETLMLVLHAWEGRINWQVIKEQLAGSLKRMWIEHLSSYHGPHDILDMIDYEPPYTDAFFPHGWPELEEIAIDPYVLEGNSIMIPQNVKVCRIVGETAREVVRRHQPSSKNADKLLNFRNEEGAQTNLKVVALGTLDRPDIGKLIRHPFFYTVFSDPGQNRKSVSSRRSVTIDETAKKAPDSHILWLDRTDKPWSDKHGSFWS